MAHLRPSSPAARAFARSRCRAYLRPGARMPHRPAGMLFVPPLFTIVNPIPANVSSQALTTQTLTVTTPCTMTAKLWGGGGGGFDPFNSGVPRGGGGGFATAVFSLQAGDVVTYAAGGKGIPAIGITPPIPGTSGSGLRNGGTGYGPGGGATELYINGIPVLLAGGGGGASQTYGGGGGGASGANGGDFDITQSGGRGASSSGPGAAGGGGENAGNPGVGGTGGDGGPAATGGVRPAGGGGGGGRYGGGGGGGSVSTIATGGGGGSGYDSTGVGTLTAATNWQAANSSDPDWTGNAGNAEVDGLVVLKFVA